MASEFAMAPARFPPGKTIGNPPPIERILMRLDKSGGQDACWPWLGAIHQRQGYGVAYYQGKPRRAHRVVWEITNGPPGDKFVLHHCDNPPCCNPSHLFLGTHQDNMRDMYAKGRGRPHPATETHCRRGHEFTPDNTKMNGRWRRCVTCLNESYLRRSHKRRKENANG